MNSSIQIAVDILSALLTGGFLLFFVETMHIESDVKQRFKSIMNPFYHKLSKMTVYIGYMRSAMSFPNNERGEWLKKDMSYIEKTGIIPNTSGRDLPYMKADDLGHLCEIINDVWYTLEQSSQLRQEISIDNSFRLDIARKSLEEVSDEYKDSIMDVNLLHKATGDFYCKYWQPVEHCTINYEYWEKKAGISRLFIFAAMGVSVLSLIITMLWAGCINPVIPCALAVLSSLLFAVCIGIMAFLINLSNKLFRAA